MHRKLRPTPPSQSTSDQPAQPAVRIWTSLDLINWTKDYFQKKGVESPRLEAELLLSSVLNVPRIRLYVDFEKAIAPEHLAQYREKVKRRGESREPLQYIIGSTDFLGLNLKISPAVLIPRPETEELALWGEERLRVLMKPHEPAPPESAADPALAAENPPASAPPQTVEAFEVLDLCTGSGCLGLYIASKFPSARVVASDISENALVIATENAKALKVDTRMEFRCGDLFSALQSNQKEKFALLVSNPPYVDPAARESLAPEVRNHEPSQALFADDSGLSVLRRILNDAPDWLLPGGWLGLEFGAGQAETLLAMATAHGGYTEIQIKKDHRGLPRLLIAQKRQA